LTVGLCRRNAYRWVLVGYAGICALWIPLIAWVMPNDSFRVGMVYLSRPDGTFETRQRSTLDRQYRRATSLQDFVAAATSMRPHRPKENLNRRSPRAQSRASGSFAASSSHAEAGLVDETALSSSDPAWNASAGTQQQHDEQHDSINGGGTSRLHSEFQRASSPDVPDSPASPVQIASSGRDGAEVGPESIPLPPDVAWGPLVFEARRFVELRKKSFKGKMAVKSSTTFQHIDPIVFHCCRSILLQRIFWYGCVLHTQCVFYAILSWNAAPPVRL
jgi:hypothetical protein